MADTNGGNGRLDRIERILEEMTASFAAQQKATAGGLASFDQLVKSRLQEVAESLRAVASTQQVVMAVQQEMAARQQYHDEAFERHSREMKVLREAQDVDSENIRALARIAEIHDRRLTDLEGGEAQ